MGRHKSAIPRCSSTLRVTASLILSFWPFTPTGSATSAPEPPSGTALQLQPQPPSVPITQFDTYHDFTLRHIFHHGTYQDPKLHKRLDVPPDDTIWALNGENEDHQLPSSHLFVRSKPMKIQRLGDRRLAIIESHLSQARRTGETATLAASHWTMDEVLGPNVTDKDTIVSLARAAADAYLETREDVEWEDVGGALNHSQSFGWQEDGLRGHIFADKDNGTILVGLKGTSPAVFDGEGTTTKDKVNDNLFFSCCCAQGGQYLWRHVCDCYSTTYTCNQTCLVKALKHENRYYRAAIELYTNVTELYPESNVWLTGHSLGGAVSSLLGMTFGIPTVTFEAPGEALAASRLGLPAPPNSGPNGIASRQYTGTYHFGHTADPVFMGTCNGATAACTLGGYALESQCHAGSQCVYDTVSDLGWRVGIGNHKIHNVIDSVLRRYDKVPQCVSDNECVDCFNWKFFESNGSESTTTPLSTGTTTRTRTSTCKTPGWWGCLDETTTTTGKSSTSFTSASSTCKTPGWFGCNDLTTTMSASSLPSAVPAPHITASPTMSAPLVTSKSSCHHHGWFGDCADPTSSATASNSPAVSHHCSTPAWFRGCRDKHTTRNTGFITSAAPPRSPTLSSSTSPSTCTHEAWFGLICLDPSPSHSFRTHGVSHAVPTPDQVPDEGSDWKDEM